MTLFKLPHIKLALPCPCRMSPVGRRARHDRDLRYRREGHQRKSPRQIRKGPDLRKCSKMKNMYQLLQKSASTMNLKFSFWMDPICAFICVLTLGVFIVKMSHLSNCTEFLDGFAALHTLLLQGAVMHRRALNKLWRVYSRRNGRESMLQIAHFLGGEWAGSLSLIFDVQTVFVATEADSI